MNSASHRAHALLTELRSALDLRLSTKDLQPQRLIVDQESSVVFGTKKLFMVEDERDLRYVVKAADPPLAQAEETSYRILALGGRASIPTRRFEGELEGVGVVEGLLKPYLTYDSSKLLSTESTEWSDDQRLVLAASHPWEWLLDNLDANQSQYALIGDGELPVMIDWDRAFHRAGEAGLSRFHQHRANLPNLRNFLYADYVDARVELELSVMIEEARRIQSLPEAELRQLLMTYADVRFPELSDRRAFVRRFVHRKRTAVRNFDRFCGELVRERRLQTASRLPVERRFTRWYRRVAIQLLRAVNAVVQSPIGTAARVVLRWFRARRTVRPAS